MMIKQRNHQHPSQSPLWMITQDPLIHAFINQLQALKHQLEHSPANQLAPIYFNQQQMADIKQAFSALIVQGERALHSLSALLMQALTQTDFSLNSVVLGKVHQESFYLSQPVTKDQLLQTTDIDLGTQILNRILVKENDIMQQPELVANFVEYLPIALNQHQIHKMISRFKAEEEIWNKVLDELFEIDQLVKRDKSLVKLSGYIKDVFGLKIIVSDQAACAQLHQSLVELELTPINLRENEIKPTQHNRQLAFLETKNYLLKPKHSGWRAIKSIIRWQQTLFELQIEPLQIYLMEQAHIGSLSHGAYRQHRHTIRSQLAEQMPLFKFFQQLLVWLFSEADLNPKTRHQRQCKQFSSLDGIEVVLLRD